MNKQSDCRESKRMPTMEQMPQNKKKNKSTHASGRGRPTKFNELIKSKIINLIKEGKTVAQVAEIVGISPTTLGYWQNANQDFMISIRESRHIADDLVEASLLSRALGYSHPAVKIMMDKDGNVVREDYIEQYPPDTKAQEFWLKNRKPKKWREKSEVEHSGKIENLSDEELIDKIQKALESLKK